MSTLKVNAIQDTGGKGFYPARAWINFNGMGTVSIRDDENVSSLTDLRVGGYGVNYSNSMSNTTYCVQALSCYGSAEAGGTTDVDYINGIASLQRDNGNTATGQTKVLVGYTVGQGTQDHAQIMVTTHGD